MQNILLQSQTFTTAPWATAGTGAAAPTLTANAATAPDSTNTATKVVYPAVSGAGNGSFVYQQSTSVANFPYLSDIYVKGNVGGEHIWMMASLTGGAGTWTEVSMVATTSWQRFNYHFANKPAAQFIEIGVDLRDTNQSAQSAQTVFIWGAGLYLDTYVVPTYIATTNAGSSAQTQTLNCPSGVAFRDFTNLTKYNSGTAITAQNSGTYNAGGVSDPYLYGWSKIGSTYHALANCTTVANRNTWPNGCHYTSTDGLTWTDDAAHNPVITATASAWDNTYILHYAISPVGCNSATYCMYYSGEKADTSLHVGLATSSDLVSWTKYGSNPLSLSSAGSGSFTNNESLPTIICIPKACGGGATLYMYTAYGGTGGSTGIYVWTSPANDGINWTWGGNVLHQPITGDWDFTNFSGLLDPYVYRDSAGMYEMGVTTFFSSGAQKIGYYVSPDGLQWWKYGTAAIVTQSSNAYAGTNSIGDAVFLENAGKFDVLFNDDNGTTIANGYAATMADFPSGNKLSFHSFP